MITIEEDNNLFVPATSFMFERTEEIRTNLEDCTKDELLDLTKHMFRKLEGAYMKADDAVTDMAKLIGWQD